MSRESEKAMKAMHRFLEENTTEDMSMETVNELLQNFTVEYNNNRHAPVTEKTAKTADDFLELAEEAPSGTKAEKYIRKALELDPDNIDAVIASLDLIEDSWEYFRKLSEAVRNGTKQMEKKGLMDKESIGHYWGILETRPYMRLLEKYMSFMLESGMMNAAAEECEEMIRLCENDNLGIRFRLMHIYAFLEKEEPALELHEKYSGNEETQLLLPLSVLYFKMRDFEKAEEYLKRMNMTNKDTKKFFRAVKKNKIDHYLDEMNDYGYRPFSIQELIVDMMENSFLFRATPLYFEWAYEKTRSM